MMIMIVKKMKIYICTHVAPGNWDEVHVSAHFAAMYAYQSSGRQTSTKSTSFFFLILVLSTANHLSLV
jgi:hypothetical protein